MAKFRMVHFFCRLLIGALAFFLFVFSKFSGAAELLCPASDEYISHVARFAGLGRADQDYSCLTDYPSIQATLKNYQLIDARKSVNDPVEQAWVISVDELKHKSFLAGRPLLLLGDGFSRVALASDCALLKKHGFGQEVKMLIGGVPQWHSVSARVRSPTVSQMVSARDVVIEYFNGRVSIVAASGDVASKLEKIGFSKFHTLGDDGASSLTNIAISSSNHGFDPVVYIGDSESSSPPPKNMLPNLYQLHGGVDALIAQINIDSLVDAMRDAPQQVGAFCAQ